MVEAVVPTASQAAYKALVDFQEVQEEVLQEVTLAVLES